MGMKPSYGSWPIIALVIAVVIVLTGALLTLCRRRLAWQWGRRNIWSICEEWRQRLSWLWAPREEKVGLVKAQHPTAQSVPGLYRQAGNVSQNILHSDSDLRLDAQGAFTRFEAVDRDLHPPLGSANAIPPQPLRPAPQPRSTGRPRPSPLQAPSASSEYLRLQSLTGGGPGPLTPPPPLPRNPNPASYRGSSSFFIFQNSEPKCYNPSSPYKVSSLQSNEQSSLRFDTLTTRSILGESIQMTRYAIGDHPRRYNSSPDDDDDADDDADDDNDDDDHQDQDQDQDQDIYSTRNKRVYRSYEIPNDENLRYSNSGNGQHTEESTRHIKQQQQPKYHPHQRHHVRKESETGGNQANFNIQNGNGNSTAQQTIMESIYGSHAVDKLLHNSENWGNDLSTESQTFFEMLPSYLRNSASTQPAVEEQDLHQVAGYRRGSSEIQGLQRVSRYIESLPDLPDVYDSTSDIRGKHIIAGDMFERQLDSCIDNREQHHPADGDGSVAADAAAAVPPPPPAPPDLLPFSGARDVVEKKNNSPTTGERIFSALRSVTSQSYIDASEFYNSVLSSAQQQVPRFAFPTITRSSLSLEPESPGERDSSRAADATAFYADTEAEVIGIDGSRRRAYDLYSPELNLEAHRTAQEVYNSLQDPPASPLLLRDLSQEPYPAYMSDPSFTRTSEDIFNSIEQRRKSMEMLNGIHESYVEMEAPVDSTRRRSSQDLYAALEEVQLKRRLSQSVEESYGGYVNGESISELGGRLSPLSRRGSQQAGPEPEPPPDESNLQRAISCESLCSDTSVNLGDLEDVNIVGHVCVGLEHERWGGRGADCEGDLAVCVLEARDLVAPDGRPAQDTLARVCLLPDRQTHVQTRLYRGSPSPSYQEKFLFPLDGGPIGRTLLVEVPAAPANITPIFSVESSIGGGASLLGEASLKLGPAARPPATTWLPLVTPALPIPHLGELMFSLSYLPTAERLTLVVVKARNLRGANPLVPGDLFVKVYLLQQGKKIHKKKTSAKRGEKSPIFNEAIIFSVPPHALQTIQLRLTVAENSADPANNSKAFSVGHVIVGSSATGKSLAHWRQMLAALRRPVVMWHPLRK